MSALKVITIIKTILILVQCHCCSYSLPIENSRKNYKHDIKDSPIIYRKATKLLLFWTRDHDPRRRLSERLWFVTNRLRRNMQIWSVLYGFWMEEEIRSLYLKEPFVEWHNYKSRGWSVLRFMFRSWWFFLLVLLF